MIWINLRELKGDLKLLKGESLIFHCEVLEFSVRSSKKGNMFGVLEVCNDCEEFRFFLFGEDFVNFKQHGVKGKQILILQVVEVSRLPLDADIEIEAVCIK